MNRVLEHLCFAACKESKYSLSFVVNAFYSLSLTQGVSWIFRLGGDSESSDMLPTFVCALQDQEMGTHASADRELTFS